MPPTVKQSPLVAKYGARMKKVLKEHAHDEPSTGFSRLPPGINDGRAQIIQCELEKLGPDTKEKQANGLSAAGEFQLRLAAVVAEPESVVHNGQVVKCAGGQSRPFPIRLYDNKKPDGSVVTFEDNLQVAMDEMKKLGCVFSDEDDPSALELAVADVAERKPFFKIRTSVRPSREAGKPDGTWENWDGVKGLEDYVPPDPSVRQVDNTGGTTHAPTDNGTMTYRDDADLDSLLARADADDEEAQNALNEMAAKATGKTVEQVQETTATWREVYDLASGSAAPADDAPAEPAVGEIWKYQPIDPKTKKGKVDGKKKPVYVEVEVKKVDKKNQLVDLVNNTDKKTPYPKIPFDQLVAS